MKQFAGALLVLMVGVFLFDSCNKPNTIGANFLPGEEGFELRYTDTLSIIAETILSDPLTVHGPFTSQQITNHLVGSINDPVFGSSIASLYSTYRISFTSPNFKDATFDSLVLALTYATDDHYGDLTAPQNLKFYRMLESPVNSTEYLSDQTFLTDPTPVADITFVPNLDDSLTISIEDTTIRVAPQLRVRLNDQLGQDFLSSFLTTDGNPLDTISNSAVVDGDTLLIYSGNVNFNRYFSGLHIVPDPSNTAILGFNTYSTYTILRLYYTKDGDKRFFDFPINFQATKVSSFQQDLASNPPVVDFLDNPTKGDSLVFVQSMAGVNTKITFPTLKSLGNILVNKADLVLNVADFQDTTLYTIPPQLVLQERLGEELDYIADVWVAIRVGADTISSTFDGKPVMVTDSTGQTQMQYRLNLSGHLQDIVRESVNEEIYITTYPKAEVPYRVTLGGPKHSLHPMKLELIYTKLDE